jgi:hypothetical protein
LSHSPQLVRLQLCDSWLEIASLVGLYDVQLVRLYDSWLEIVPLVGLYDV